MLDGMLKRGVMFILKNEWKYDSDNQRVAREGKPYAMPVFSIIGVGEKLIDQETAGQTAEHSAETVYHHHK